MHLGITNVHIHMYSVLTFSIPLLIFVWLFIWYILGLAILNLVSCKPMPAGCNYTHDTIKNYVLAKWVPIGVVPAAAKSHFHQKSSLKNTVEHLADIVLRGRLNISFIFINWTQTWLQMNDNIALCMLTRLLMCSCSYFWGPSCQISGKESLQEQKQYTRFKKNK